MMGLVVNGVRIQKCDFIYNKNAFQYDAYRPLQWPSRGRGSTLGRGGFCSRGVFAGGVSAWGMSARGVSA